MNKNEIPEIVQQFIGIYYRLRIWSHDDKPTYCEQIVNYLHFIWLVLFVISMAVGAYTTSDEDECVFLTGTTVAYVVIVNRLWYILWRKREFLSLVYQISTHHFTEHENEFVQNSNKLNAFMAFVRRFVILLVVGCVPSVFVYPIVSEKHILHFNIAFPFDRSSISGIGFWMAYVFVIGGAFDAVICALFISMGWYLMLRICIEYNLLGDQFRQMGARKGKSDLNVSHAEQLKLFQKELKAAIKSHERINGALKNFETYFGGLFLLQVFTGAACICGGVYALAFGSHDDLIKDVISCAFIAYSTFDIFIIMYLGNEIKLSIDELSFRSYESNWMQQTLTSQKSIIILNERLKQPQELVLGLIYPLNLLTFTSIMRGAYSMLNVLLNLRQ